MKKQFERKKKPYIIANNSVKEKCVKNINVHENIELSRSYYTIEY